MNKSIPSWLKKDFGHTFFDSEHLKFPHVISVIGNNWLLDSIVNFYYLYLENVKYKNKNFLFLCPNTTFMVPYLSEKDNKNNLEPLGIQKKDIIFIPVNDNNNISGAGGGTHWSLLVYFRKDNSFHTYDSARNMNLLEAKKLAVQLSPYITGKKLKDKESLELVVHNDVQRQKNGNDCGAFLLAFTDRIAEGKDCKSGIEPKVLRKEILGLIKKYSGK